VIESLPFDLDRVDSGSARVFSAAPGHESIVRTSLVNRLCAARDVPVVTIVAPAGYGKTTLLSQWIERDPRRTLWLTLDPGDDAAEIFKWSLEPALLESELLAVVDDVHRLRSRTGLDALRDVLAQVPPGATVALAARSRPLLPLARLRVEGRLLELGSDDLALTEREAQSLLRHAGLLLPPREADELVKRLEGWPAALVLAALSLRSGADAATLTGDDRLLADYLETEHLAQLSSTQRRFALHTSVLDALSADACDALLGHRDSGRVLDCFERLGVVVPLDHRRRRYRYRHVVRDLLRAELERSEPKQARALHRSAAGWSEEHGATEEALRHAFASGDLDRVAELAAGLVVPASADGRLDAAESWLELLRDHAGVERHPDMCIAGSWLHALRGRPHDAQRWADAAARALPGDDPRLRILQALRCRDGADQMLDDTTIACPALAPGSTWRPLAMLARGVARLLAGDTARAEGDLVDAVESASAVEATSTRIVGLCIRALLATDRDAHADADALVAEAREVADGTGSEPSAVQLLLEAVSARAAARRGEREQAVAEAEHAERLLPVLTYAVPWLSTLAALELVHVHLALADPEGARDILRRVADILRVRPRLGTLVQRIAELDRRARAMAEPEGRWASSLTPAETRLLPLLATHLSFREIGERLFVSRNTVKTQAISVYRKFGVSSRSEAISRALDLGLIDETAVVPKRKLLSVG